MSLQLRTLMLALMVFCMGSSNALAKTIKLYDQPKADAKVVATLNTESGFISIFKQKDGTWMKIGDPTNGNVGWVKSDDINNSGPITSGFTVTQHIYSTGGTPQSYVVQYGAPQALSPEEAKAIVKKTEISREAIQKQINDIMQNMYNTMNVQLRGAPVILPVLIVPTPPKETKSK